jgi:hypothetical protein
VVRVDFMISAAEHQEKDEPKLELLEEGSRYSLRTRYCFILSYI